MDNLRIYFCNAGASIKCFFCCHLLPCDPAVYWEEVVEFSLSWEGDCDLRCVLMGISTGEDERTGIKSLVGALRPTFSRLLILRTIFP